MIKTLPREELVNVLSHEPSHVAHLIIAGCRHENNITFLTGDLERITVPLSIFEPGAKYSPDFDQFEIIDYGNAIKFGEYEACVDVILGIQSLQSLTPKNKKLLEIAHDNPPPDSWYEELDPFEKANRKLSEQDEIVKNIIQPPREVKGSDKR